VKRAEQELREQYGPVLWEMLLDAKGAAAADIAYESLHQKKKKQLNDVIKKLNDDDPTWKHHEYMVTELYHLGYNDIAVSIDRIMTKRAYDREREQRFREIYGDDEDLSWCTDERETDLSEPPCDPTESSRVVEKGSNGEEESEKK
jgi:hypothetical protein